MKFLTFCLFFSILKLQKKSGKVQIIETIRILNNNFEKYFNAGKIEALDGDEMFQQLAKGVNFRLRLLRSCGPYLLEIFQGHVQV